MKILVEDDLWFDFSSAIDAIKFDEEDPNSQNFHGQTSMAAVDFVVETPDCIMLIELKDPLNPNARQRDQRRFIETMGNGDLAHKLGQKFRDAWIYRWSENKVNGKPIHCVALVEWQDLAMIQQLRDHLVKKLPLQNLPRWTQPFAAKCFVFNLTTWDQEYQGFRARRISRVLGATP